MPDFLLLMHRTPSSPGPLRDSTWEQYLAQLRASGRFQGGSAIGTGLCFQKVGTPPPVTEHLAGFIRISARDLDEARQFLAGNPVFEGGGTVEIRELPQSD